HRGSDPGWCLGRRVSSARAQRRSAPRARRTGYVGPCRDGASRRARMQLQVDGSVLRDQDGRQRVLHGISLVAKGATPGQGTDEDYRRSFYGTWTPADIADLAARGFTLVRLGVIWAAVEPEPGHYDESYLDHLGAQLDLLHRAGIAVLLDAHQDLYSQCFGDGAPPWATLTDEPFTATDLWSDAYLTEPALHQALDAFWANTPGPGGVGL